MTANIANAFKTANQVYRVTLPLGGADWADEFFYLSAESSGTEGKWKCYPYQVAILNWMTSDDIEEVNFIKSRRVGYTKCLLAAAASLIVQKNRNIAIWQPTDGDAQDFVTDEVETALRDVPVLGDRLRCPVGAKSKYNTVAKKVFQGATLDVKGGKSARNFRRMTKDVAIYDECDAFDRDIEGEGSPFELGDGRLDQAPFPKSIRGSTPKTKGASLIESAVENSEAIFYRFLPCPHCGEYQHLEFSQLKWEKDNPKTAFYVCKINGCVIHYREYAGMDENGRWQTFDGIYYNDHRDTFHNALHELVPKPLRIGARIWAAYSYLRPWSYLASKWVAASKDAKTGNVTTLKSIVNNLLGETFEEKGESLDPTLLSERGEHYLAGGTIPDDVLVITAGVDIQGGMNARMELEIVGWGVEHESWSLAYEEITGDAEKSDIWEHLDEILLQKFTRESGLEVPINAVFIDSGYLASEVYKFTGPRRNRRIYATKGVVTGTLCNKGSWQGKKASRNSAILRTTNVNDGKTIVFNRLNIDNPGPGYCHFPAHYPESHFKKLTNEEKKAKRKGGVLAGYEWVKLGPNEPLDCRCYATAALAYLNPNFPRIKAQIEQQDKASLAGATPRPTGHRRKVRSSGIPL